MHQPSEWDEVDAQLFDSQYGYIKLGLLLTKIRNTSAWKYCGTKFDDFKTWCRSMINLPVWQATQYIEAAEIALYLVRTGNTMLPKNLSQCLALRPAYHAEEGYYGDRPQLDAAWANVTNHYQAHQITAGKIHAIVNPDWQDKQATKPSKTMLDRAAKIAKERGISIDELLSDLLDGYEEPIADAADVDDVVTLNQEQQEIVDRVEYQWLKPQPEKIVETFDRLMDNLVGRLIPKVRVQLV
jgi:hypothetical protein